jgi:beta-lactamase regulating signal transducer with metallopeptidase domain
MYHASVHLLYASIVGAGAWMLTSIRSVSATTKYWIWVVTAFNFVVPSGALIDKVWGPHLTWARPLGTIVGAVKDMTEGWTAVVVGVIWLAGAFAMLMRLLSRMRREHPEIDAPNQLRIRGIAFDFLANGIPVSFGKGHLGPAVCGVLYPRILLPSGIDRVLNEREFNAVLIHELAHARRRDNLIRLVYEVSLCALWCHPFIWLVGARIALYRELSCDESVIRHAHGQALVSALAKLAVPEQAGFLQATASSHLSYRLERLADPAQVTHNTASRLLTLLFAAVIAACIFQTIAHTGCCFVPKH